MSLEETESIEREIKIPREKDFSKEPSTSCSSHQARPPMKPFTLTRNAPRAKVFRAGYSRLVSVMVEDPNDQHEKLGELTDQ